MEERKRNKNKRRKMIIYLCTCLSFAIPIILIVTVTQLFPPNAKDTTSPIICLNQTGNCSMDSSYKPNLDCIFNDTNVNLNGGKSCKTECSYDHQSYKCVCPNEKTWDPPLLNCSMTCRNESTNCSNFASGQHCIPSTDNNNGKDCVTLCSSSFASFECICMPGYVWDKLNLNCILECPTNHSECAFFSNKTGQSCFRNISDAYNCRIDCTPSTCAPYICDCRNGLFFDQFYYLSCNLKCEHDTSNTDCTDYITNTACTNLESQLHYSDTCIKKCSPTTGRSFSCAACRSGGTWSPISRTCNRGFGKACRSSMDNTTDACAICGDKFRPGLNCTNSDRKICKTKCNQLNALDFDPNSCI